MEGDATFARLSGGAPTSSTASLPGGCRPSAFSHSNTATSGRRQRDRVPKSDIKVYKQWVSSDMASGSARDLYAHHTIPRRFAAGERQLHPSPCTLHPSPCTLHPSPCTLHPSPCTLAPAPYTLAPAPYTYTLYPTLYTPLSALCFLLSKPYTLHPAPLHPTPCILHPTPYTVHRTP